MGITEMLPFAAAGHGVAAAVAAGRRRGNTVGGRGERLRRRRPKALTRKVFHEHWGNASLHYADLPEGLAADWFNGLGSRNLHGRLG